MTNLEPTFIAAIVAAKVVVARIPDGLAIVKDIDDSALLSSQRELSELRRMVDARSSLVAGEVAYRSRRDLGYGGLAQKEGFQNAEKLVQATTGSTRREASTLVTAGTIVHESRMLDAVDSATGEVPEGFVVREPWLAEVGTAVANGLLTVDGARAIRSGLGEPGEGESGVTSEALGRAVRELLDAAAELGDGASYRRGLNADELYRRAKEKRDDLDETGITEREQLLYSQRSLRRTTRPNGLSRYTLDPDLEMSAWLDDVYDKLTSPRRGGPRFIDPGDREWSDRIATDSRTTEQYLHDAFAGLLRKGVDADLAEARAEELESLESQSVGIAGDASGGDASGGDAGSGPGRASRGISDNTAHDRGRRRTPRIIGSRPPAVRVLVTDESLYTRSGHGRIDGSDTPISIGTVERLICTSGTIPIRFGDDGNVIDLGRESRLFTSRQKIALSARDGGCMFEGCDRPAGWTEAHHINHWSRDAGRTDLADGILLCRHHHMLVHNNHWEIVRKQATYWLIPPPDIDPLQRPRQLKSRSAALRDLQRQHGSRLRASA